MAEVECEEEMGSGKASLKGRKQIRNDALAHTQEYESHSTWIGESLEGLNGD